MKLRSILIVSLLLCASTTLAQTELIAVIKSEDLNTKFGKRIMPLGDQNGDGCAELIVFDLLGHGYYYLCRPSADTITSYALRFDNISSRANNIGDVNGDNVDDFVALGTAVSRHKLNLYFGGAGLDTIRDQWFGTDSLFGIGYTAYSPDLNGDGTPELVSFGDDNCSAILYELVQPPDSTHLLILPPANLNYADYSQFGANPIVGDFNGDGTSDLALGLTRRLASRLSGAVYFYWGGASFDTIPELIISRPGGYVAGCESFGEILENLGDLNGDGFDDFFASSSRSNDDSLGFVFFGGSDIDTVPELILPRPHSVVRRAGDLNHDGFDDFIQSYPMPFSTLGEVNVYYGGPAMDSISDITFTAKDMPGYQVEFGLDCSGVGDFNGDGLDDFAFSYENGYSYGIVLICSGTNVNSVDYDYEPTLPNEFILKQNYPNPFNASTQIEFGLPERKRVRLAIFDILGQEVRVLVDRELSAGTYRMEWDGNGKGGHAVASGVYLCKLTAGDAVQSRKMALLK